MTLHAWCLAILLGEIADEDEDTPTPTEMRRYLAEFCGGDAERFAPHVLGVDVSLNMRHHAFHGDDSGSRKGNR